MFSTRNKILIARGLSTLVLTIRRLFGLPSEVIVTRQGVTWSLNLREGIDFSIFLLGGFEVRTLRKYTQLIKNSDVVLDIGANVGAHTLPLAHLVGPDGKVIAFEPTAYAFTKQKTNISLNPRIESRINAYQMMLMANDNDPLPDLVYSSWPLETASDLHNEHYGRLMTTEGALKGTLDRFISKLGIEEINFIKLDVDGHEREVLLGAKVIIEKTKPAIMLELAPYVYRKNPSEFDNLLYFLWGSEYEISDIATGRLMPQDVTKIRRVIPKGGAINALAIHRETSALLRNL
jgi:FkbM family methyltransferase